jgi:hypothetical protein
MDLSDASEKIPSDTTEVDPGTFRLVVQRLNHYATPGPNVLLDEAKLSIVHLGIDTICFHFRST